jgi:hypothetical protein
MAVAGAAAAAVFAGSARQTSANIVLDRTVGARGAIACRAISISYQRLAKRPCRAAESGAGVEIFKLRLSAGTGDI